MDAKQFLAEFGHIANAPGGVQRLREMILSFAVMGKLTSHEVNDTPVDITLEALSQRRNEILSIHSLAETRKHKNLDAARGVFDVPVHWGWESLAYVSSWPLKDGDWVESKDQNPAGKVRLIQLADIGIGEYKNKSARFLTDEKAIELNCYFLNKGDVLIARLPDPLGRACIFPGDEKRCVTIVDVAVCRAEKEFINSRYLVHCINSRETQAQIEDLATGTTRKRVATGKLGLLALPIPPLEEQSRIVAKVDELMALCDKLEAQQQKKRKLQNKLRQSVLQAVANAESPKELQDSWERLAGNFSHLFAEAEDVNALISLLMSLAVRGLLTPESNDIPDVDSITQACTSLREDYISRKLMRQQKGVSVASTSVVYPENWKVTAFDNVALVIGGVTKGRNLRDKEKVTCPYLSVANVQRGYFNLNNLKSIEVVKDELEKYQVCEGDILITEGGDWDKVGRTAIWKNNIENCLHQNHVIKARIPSGLIANEWIELVFNSDIGRDYFADASKQTTNLASINMTQLRSFSLPIPPLEQQKAILESLKGLITSCENLREKHKRKQKTAERLATAAIASLTGISTPQQEEPMKVPKTELKAPVRLGTVQPSSNTQAPLASLLARHNGEMGANDLWQRFDGEIDAFYAQLKTEVMHGWIAEPTGAQMLEKEND